MQDVTLAPVLTLAPVFLWYVPDFSLMNLKTDDMNDDFGYLAALVDEFFNKRRIGRSLQVIEDQKITGWEVWFQVEFAYFLSMHASQPEWWREWPVELDGRMAKERTFCRPDFIIRKRGWRRETYTAMEVKQHPDAGICFSNMMKDVRKISTAKVSSLEIRSMWVLGIHKKKSKADLRNLILSRFEAAGMAPPDKNLVIRFIPWSSYAYSMF